MIQASELRIGSLVYNPQNELCKIAEISGITETVRIYNLEFWQDEIGFGYSCNEISGIPLTDELLLKMGFIQVDMADMGMHTFIDINFDLSINYHNLTKTLWIGEHNTNINTVHGCQNLIYVLTGQELTLS